MLQRFILLILSVLTISTLALATAAESPTQTWRSNVSNLIPEERPVPIPWSNRLPFPWTMAQGVWLAQKGDFQSYFSFKIVRNRTSTEKQLLVRQIDPQSCDVIASGIGLATDQTLSAQMLNAIDGSVYSLGLSGFQDADLPKQLGTKPIKGKAMIMSITVVGPQVLTHYLGIQKMTDRLQINCQTFQDIDRDLE